MATDPQPGPDWWLASDGKWYPPESHPNHPAPLPPPPPPPTAYVPPSANPRYMRGSDNVPEAVSRGSRGRFSKRALLTIAGCILYIVSPVDVLPEAFLGPFGLADDAIAAAILAIVMRSRSRD